MNATTPSEASVEKIRAVYDGHAAFYAPSVVTDAALFLDALLATAADHGHEADADGLGGLTMAAADAASRKHGLPRPERTAPEAYALHAALREALVAEGLVLSSYCPIRMGVGVDPLPGGPSWGMDQVGLAVALFVNSGWDLLANTARTRAFSIYAPATPGGAAEVAGIVHGILRGDLADPFRTWNR
ncbi:hypothetical protein ACIQMP_07805 [Streptomyces sp. NPDC091385]|uniref:hypothetical protein n=1 Tax=Streptomyces sp. NPDC091385 TaxID=3365997 RepID=UPI0038049B43